MERRFIARGLTFHVFPSGPVASHDLDLHNKLFQFWHEQWLSTFEELKGTKMIYSDDFNRQHERTFLTFANDIIGYMGHSWFNLALDADRRHSYFKTYPTDALDTLRKEGLSKVMTMGYFCVLPRFRKVMGGALVAQCLMALTFKRFVNSSADTLISFARNNRKVNELIYSNGSRCLIPKLTEHNVEVDVTYALKHEVREPEDNLVRETVSRLWSQQIIHRQTEPKAVPLRRVA